MDKPRRILGFNTCFGRGWVVSTDQSRLHRPEFIFVDTPSHPNLQMVCSRIIDKHGNDIVRHAAVGKSSDDIGIHDLRCEGLTFSFAFRFVCPKKDTERQRRLENVYLEGKTTAKHGIVVMVPVMHNIFWGFHGRGVPVKMTKQEVDRWIDEVAAGDSCPL
jgi:hypothetical protein